MASGETQEKITVTSSTETLGTVITLMERIKAFIDKHGLKGTFTSLMTLFIAGVMGFFIINPSKAFEAFEEFTAKRHNEMVQARIQADPYIRRYLMDFRNEVAADRVFLLETHNGGSNLTNLPFLYVDMTYAEPNSVLTVMENEYRNVRLSRYPLATIVADEGYWFGEIEEMFEIDPELYYRLLKEDVKHVGFMMMYGKNAIPSGVLGVVYTDDENVVSKNTVVRFMQKYTNVLSPLLSSTEEKIKK